MSPWLVILPVALLSAGFKFAGPALLKDRRFPPRVETVIDALAPALLAGLVVVDLLGYRWHDADWTALPGLTSAVALRLGVKKAPDLVCVLTAVAVTIAVRLLTGDV